MDTAFIRGHNDLVMLTDAAALLFQPADARLDRRQRLLCPRFGQSFGQPGQAILEPLGEAVGDRDLLGLAAGSALGELLGEDFDDRCRDLFLIRA
jgi:hypothetical protein